MGRSEMAAARHLRPHRSVEARNAYYSCHISFVRGFARVGPLHTYRVKRLLSKHSNLSPKSTDRYTLEKVDSCYYNRTLLLIV